MKTNYSQYPPGRRSYSIQDWNNCDPYQIIPEDKDTELKDKQKSTYPALKIMYLKTDVESNWIQKDSNIKFIVGKEGDIVVI
jgi:hypothetical protein